VSSAAALAVLARSGPRPASEDAEVTRTRVLGTYAWVAFRYDRAEATRRAALGLGPVLAWDLLDTLMELPAGLPVPAAALSPQARRRVSRAPAGVVRVVGGEVTRDLVPAVTPLLAVVTAREWGSGLARASRFAPYCRRIVIGPGFPASGTLAAAARLGIGVASAAHRSAEVLTEPEPVRDWQPTTAWWRFCEVLYGHAARRRPGAG
jgi:hypothetical protein